MVKPRSVMSRRALFRRTLAITGGAGVASHRSVAWAEQSRPDRRANRPSGQRVIVATDSTAVVETTAGLVRGYSENGIRTFKGIPYGTASARFMPPAKPAPWSG